MALATRSFLVFLLFAAALSFSGAAIGDEQSVNDPDDSRGELDIASVRQHHGRWKGLVRHTLTTYEEWDVSLLAGDSDEEGETWGRIFFTLNSSRFCCGSGEISVKVNRDGSLYAAFYRGGFRGFGRAWRPDDRSVTVEFEKKVFARKLEQYSWNGGTSYANPDNEACPGWQEDPDTGHRTLDGCFDYTNSRKHRVVNRPDVRVARIVFDPDGRDTGRNKHLNREWIVIHNFGGRSVSLSGWQLHDRGKENVYRFRDVGLGRDESFYLYTGRGTDGGSTGCNGTCHSTYYFYWDRRDYVWGNRRDAATLRNRAGDVMDRCAYDRRRNGVVDCGS